MFTVFGFYKFKQINNLNRNKKLLNKGGLVIIDNVLWHGEVVDKRINDKFTKNIRELNNFISKDKRIEKVIVPFGDGMSVCRKV